MNPTPYSAAPFTLQQLQFSRCHQSQVALQVQCAVFNPQFADQEGNKLQRPNSNFYKTLKKKKNPEGCPPKQVSAAAMTSASDEKWRPLNCFFQSGRAKDLSARCTSIHVPYTTNISVRTSEKTRSVSITKTPRLISFRRIFSVNLKTSHIPDKVVRMKLMSGISGWGVRGSRVDRNLKCPDASLWSLSVPACICKG